MRLIKLLLAASLLAIIAAFVPPLISKGQTKPAPEITPERIDNLEEVIDSILIKSIIAKAKAETLSGQAEANKEQVGKVKYLVRKLLNKKPKQKVKPIPVLVPVPMAGARTATPNGVTKKIIVKQFIAPVIPGTPQRGMSDREIRESKGILGGWYPFKKRNK